MTHEEIEKFIEKKMPENGSVTISFKTRQSFKGIFIKKQDYKELSRKNLWRIVREDNMALYKEAHNENISRIFNGSEFTGLKVAKES